MALKAEQLKGELTEQIVSRVHDRLNRDRAETAERFVRQFYANVPPDDIIEFEPRPALQRGAVDLAVRVQRQPGTARVRVYHPQLDEHGWQSGHTVVEIVNDDMPFLVDFGHRRIEPPGPYRPSGDPSRGAGAPRQLRSSDRPVRARRLPPTRCRSFMHIEVDEQTAPELLEQVAQSIEKVLTDVRFAVEDWQAMRGPMLRILETVDQMPHTLPDDEVSEARDFLLWLNDDNFTFLGYRRYRFEGDGDEARLAVVAGEGLGILRKRRCAGVRRPAQFASLPPDAQQFLRQPRLLLVTKSNRRATVHRPALMDSIFIKEYDDAGWWSASTCSSGCSLRSPTTPVPVISRICATRWCACCRAPASTRAAMTARRWSISWKTSPATSCSRSATTSCSRSPSACCIFRNASERHCSSGATRSSVHHRSRLYPARPLRHRSAPAHSGDPGEGVRRNLLGLLTQLAESVLARVQFVIETKPAPSRTMTWARSRSG